MFWETQRRVHSAQSEGQAQSRVSGFLSVASRAYERVPVQTIVVSIEERGRAGLRMETWQQDGAACGSVQLIDGEQDTKRPASTGYINPSARLFYTAYLPSCKR
jgi:hypothetical protein